MSQQPRQILDIRRVIVPGSKARGCPLEAWVNQLSTHGCWKFPGCMPGVPNSCSRKRTLVSDAVPSTELVILRHWKLNHEATDAKTHQDHQGQNMPKCIFMTGPAVSAPSSQNTIQRLTSGLLFARTTPLSQNGMKQVLGATSRRNRKKP